jgi:hypothetical protein
MSSFLKLQGVLLNKRNIQRVDILPDMYRIMVTTHETRGWTVFGVGAISSHNVHYDVVKDKHHTDYQTVSDWIKSLY